MNFCAFAVAQFFLGFRYVWESKADGAFAISEDVWNEPLGRGTEIRLHLRDEAGEYLDEFKLKVYILNPFPLSLLACCSVYIELFIGLVDKKHGYE